MQRLNVSSITTRRWFQYGNNLPRERMMLLAHLHHLERERRLPGKLHVLVRQLMRFGWALLDIWISDWKDWVSRSCTYALMARHYLRKFEHGI
jgi:hypothetical protein